MRDRITPFEYGAGARDADSRGRLRDANRLVGVAAFILMGFCIAYVTTKLPIYYTIAGILLVLLGAAVAYKPEFGLLCYFIVAPYAIGKSPKVESANSDYAVGVLPSEVVLVFLAGVWLVRMLFTGKWSVAPSELNKPFLALGGVALASLVCSMIIYDPAIPGIHHLFITQTAEAGLFILALAAFFVSANSLSGPKWIKALFYPVVFMGVYVALFRLTDTPLVARTPKPVLVTVVASGYIMSRLLFSPPKRTGRIFLIIALLLCLAVPIRSFGWISGLVAEVTLVLTLLFLKSRKAFAVGIAVVLLFCLFGFELLHSMYKYSEETGDFDRLKIWGDSARMALGTNPILGIGPGNFYAYSFKYGSVWYGEHTYTTAHNNYAQVGAEMGLLGLAAFGWLLFAGVKTGVMLFRRTRADLKWVPAAATAIFLAFALSSALGDYMFPNRANGGLFTFSISVFVWLTMGAAVAAGRVSEESTERPHPSPPLKGREQVSPSL